jgi:hypothetical protein
VFKNEDGGYVEVAGECVVNKYFESEFYGGFQFDLTM